jgi:hypothetical protein
MSHHADAAEQARVRAEELAREHSGRSGSAAEEATRAILDGLGASRRGGLAGWPSEGWNEFGLDSPDGEPLPAQALAWIWNRGLGEEIEALADGRSGSPRILVVNDAAPLPEEILLTLEQALREHGAVPIGPGPDRNSLDLEAELRRAAGLVALDDPEVEVRLADFSRTSDEVDAVLWLARGRQDGEPTLGFLLAAGEPGGSHAVAR